MEKLLDPKVLPYLLITLIASNLVLFMVALSGPTYEDISNLEANCIISTSLPGRQPISNSFMGILLSETSLMMAFSPFFKSAIECMYFI